MLYIQTDFCVALTGSRKHITGIKRFPDTLFKTDAVIISVVPVYCLEYSGAIVKNNGFIEKITCNLLLFYEKYVFLQML